MLEINYDAICVAYSAAVKEIFKQIPTMMTRSLSQKQKVQKHMTEVSGGLYMEKLQRDYHH